MALVECKECKENISEKAHKCPKCNCKDPFIKKSNCPECATLIPYHSQTCPECGYPEPFQKNNKNSDELSSHDIDNKTSIILEETEGKLDHPKNILNNKEDRKHNLENNIFMKYNNLLTRTIMLVLTLILGAFLNSPFFFYAGIGLFFAASSYKKNIEKHLKDGI